MGFHLSPSKYDHSWRCSECSKELDAIPGRFKIYNSSQRTCSKECARARKTRLQGERRAERLGAAYGAPAEHLLPDPERSEVARRREQQQKGSMPWDEPRRPDGRPRAWLAPGSRKTSPKSARVTPRKSRPRRGA